MAARSRSWPKFSRVNIIARPQWQQRHSLKYTLAHSVLLYTCCFPLYQSSIPLQDTAAIEALMVLARVANFFTNGDSTIDLTDGSRRNVANTAQAVELRMEDTKRGAMEEEVDEEAARPPYLHVRMPSLQR